MALTLNNSLALLATGSLADVYTCSSTRGAYLKSIQVSNDSASVVASVRVTMQKSGTDYSLVNNLSIPVGSAASVLTDTIVLKINDKIRGQMISGSSQTVPIILSVEEFS